MSWLGCAFLACLLLGSACSSETQSRVRPLSAYEKQLAVERGRVFRAPLASLSSDSGYRLEHLARAQLPRIHAAADMSLFIISGRVRVTIDGLSQQLRAGQSVDVPRGTWYVAEPIDDVGSSVFFVFSEPPLPSEAPNWARSAHQRALHSRLP